MEDNAASPRPTEHKLVGLTACVVIAATIQAYVYTTPTKVLTRQARSNDPAARASATRELTTSPRDASDFRMAVDALILATNDEEMDVRAEAMNALGGLLWSSASRNPAPPIPAEEVTRSLPRAQAALLGGLRDKEAFVRAMAARSLGLIAQIGPETIPPEIFAALDDEAEVVRAAAARALAVSKGDREPAIEILLRRLETDTGNDRVAYNSLAATIVPRRESIPLLTRWLTSPRPPCRGAAATMLGSLGRLGRPALGALIDQLRVEIAASGGDRAGAPGQAGPVGAIASAAGRIARDSDEVDRILPILTEGLKTTRGSDHDGLAAAIGQLGMSGAGAAPALIDDLRRLMPLARAGGDEGPARERSVSIAADALSRVAGGSPSEAEAIRLLGAGWKDYGAQTQVGAGFLNALRRMGPRALEVFPDLADDRAIGFVATPPGPNRSRRAVGIAD